MGKRSIILLLFIVVLAGMSGYVVARRWFADAFDRSLVAAGRGSDAVSLRKLTRESWERLYIFDCYTDPKKISDSLGFVYSDDKVEAKPRLGRNKPAFVRLRRTGDPLGTARSLPCGFLPVRSGLPVHPRRGDFCC